MDKILYPIPAQMAELRVKISSG